MAVHTSNGLGSGAGPGSGGDTEKLSKEELKRYRLKKAIAYVDDDERQPSEAAKSKRKQREKREKDKKIVQCNVEIPTEGRPTVQALAAAMRADSNLYPVISSVVSSHDCGISSRVCSLRGTTSHQSPDWSKRSSCSLL